MRSCGVKAGCPRAATGRSQPWSKGWTCRGERFSTSAPDSAALGRPGGEPRPRENRLDRYPGGTVAARPPIGDKAGRLGPHHSPGRRTGTVSLRGRQLRRGVQRRGVSPDPDKQSLFSDIFRVLKPGGTLAANDWLGGDDGPLSPEMVRFMDGGGLTFNWASADQTRGYLEHAGFSDIVVHDHRQRFSKFSGPTSSEWNRAASETGSSRRSTRRWPTTGCRIGGGSKGWRTEGKSALPGCAPSSQRRDIGPRLGSHRRPRERPLSG